jgi:hypothetical protein
MELGSYTEPNSPANDVRQKMLTRDDGSKCESQEEIKGLVQMFYENLFSTEPCDSSDAVLDSIPTKVTAEMNANFCKPYTDEKIETAIFQMGPTKAPGALLSNSLGFLKI